MGFYLLVNLHYKVDVAAPSYNENYDMLRSL